VKPANYLDSQEKFLIGVATKGGTGVYVCWLRFIRLITYYITLTLVLFTMRVGGVSVVKLFNAVSSR
jgi:hypothetical protein